MANLRIDPLWKPNQQCKIFQSLGQLDNSIARIRRKEKANKKRLLMALQKLEKLAKKMN
jgi:hypothetical protein